MNGLFLNALKSPHQVFCEEGILFYPRVFEGEELVRLRDACNFVLDQNFEERDRLKPDDNTYCMRHLNDSRWHSNGREHFEIIMEAVADPRCLGPVEQIFRGESLFRSTSLFFNPRKKSSEGNWHRDQQFTLANEELVKEYFEQVNRGEVESDGLQFQIALVDNDDVEYVPFSARRYDSPQEQYIRCSDNHTHNREDGMPNAMRVHQRAGDAIVFNAAGLHRGRYHVDRPRRTLMLTYTTRKKPCYDFFSHQPWMLQPGYLDGLSPRARSYFEDFIHVYRDNWIEK